MAPIFFFLIFGIIEYGAAYGDKLGVSNAVTSGTRTASAGGSDGFADYQILQSVIKSSSAMTKGSVRFVVVFKAAGVDSKPTQGCREGRPSAIDKCNVYFPKDFGTPKDSFGCDPNLELDRYWCPSNRKTSQTLASGGPPDYIGVYMEAVHPYYTGFFGKEVTLTDQAIIQIEPRQL
jgi:hypothetical protein